MFVKIPVEMCPFTRIPMTRLKLSFILQNFSQCTHVHSFSCQVISCFDRKNGPLSLFSFLTLTFMYFWIHFILSFLINAAVFVSVHYFIVNNILPMWGYLFLDRNYLILFYIFKLRFRRNRLITATIEGHLTSKLNSKTVLVFLTPLLYFLFIFYLTRCTLPDFPSVSSPWHPCNFYLVATKQQ